jgi:plasmid stabilization system protein ParE
MNYKIIQSPESKIDLDGIVNYITVRLSNPKAATDLADLYFEKLSNLSKGPRLYPLSNNYRLSVRGYRHFTFGSYIAYYTISEETRTANIVRIFYQKQNHPETL